MSAADERPLDGRGSRLRRISGVADFTCGGKLRFNPSWAGVYHVDWGSL